jgi:hypothetical protein
LNRFWNGFVRFNGCALATKENPMTNAKIQLEGPRTGPASEGAGTTRYVYPHNSAEPFDNRIDAVAKNSVKNMDRFVSGAADLLVHGLKPAAQ